MQSDPRAVIPTERKVIRVLRPGSWKKAELRLVENSEGPCVEKDYRNLSPLLRIYTAIILRREQKAYDALQGVDCIPRCHACSAGLLVIQYVEGTAISDLIGQSRGPAAFHNLELCVQAMHDKGIYHLDLRKRDNLLVTDENQVWLIDFASATHIRPGSIKGWLLRRALEFFDGYAVLKWKSVLAPKLMSPQDWSRVKWLNRIRFRT